MAHRELVTDPLFIACTRPAMMLGVPAEAIIINLIVVVIIGMWASNIAFLGFGLVFYFICRILIAIDHNMFRLLKSYFDTKALGRNKSYWGGSSPTPLKLVRHHNLKDFGLVE